MQFPARFVMGNLIWSRDGTVWAAYRVKATSYPYLSEREKLQKHAQMRMALMSLPQESMILSVCERIEPDVIGERMANNVSESAIKWSEAVGETLGALDEIDMFHRLHYLLIALPNDGVKGAATSFMSSATTMLGGWFGLAPTPVGRKELEIYVREEKKLEARLRSSITLKPLTAGEVRWPYARSMVRGMRDP